MDKIGVIGGSGLENPEILKSPQEINVNNRYGIPSSPLICGKIDGVDTVIISRHGKQHTIPPSKVNNRANIYALKEAGCTHIITTTACGSLREEIRRGDIVIPDQFIDFTRHRVITFFDEFEPGNLGHTPMADPFDCVLRNYLIETAKELKLRVHEKGTIITIEGPRFSTRAESSLFRLWGADVINMSIAPEVILANELGIPYATVAMSTDYDSWKTDEKPVTWEDVLEVFKNNVHNVLKLLCKAIPKIQQ
ncbi:MAG: S-methyl-5'-thioadenosine phosphorylase [Bacteroidales bacterium]